MAAVQAGKINTTHKLSRFCDRNCQKTRHSMHMAYSQPVAGPFIGRRRRCRQSALTGAAAGAGTPDSTNPKESQPQEQAVATGSLASEHGQGGGGSGRDRGGGRGRSRGRVGRLPRPQRPDDSEAKAMLHALQQARERPWGDHGRRRQIEEGNANAGRVHFGRNWCSTEAELMPRVCPCPFLATRSQHTQTTRAGAHNVAGQAAGGQRRQAACRQAESHAG